MTEFSPNRRRFVERSASIVGGLSIVGPAALARPESPGGAEAAHPRRADLEARVIARAWRDERYRSALLRDPRGVLSQALRTQIPSRLKIQVLQETPDHVYFVLPADPTATTDKEISSGDIGILAMGETVKTACEIPSTVMVPTWFQSIGMYGGR
jgi:hypothetical protein